MQDTEEKKKKESGKAGTECSKLKVSNIKCRLASETKKNENQ